LTQIEAVFRSLKSELGIRPIYHRLEHRVDAHILIAFLAYCLQVTLKNRLQIHAPGLTPTAVLEKLATVQMIDVWIPTRDGRWLILPAIPSRRKSCSCSWTRFSSRFPRNHLPASPLRNRPACLPRLRPSLVCGEDLPIASTDSAILIPAYVPQLRKSG
jgi:hypothetical protein